MTTNDSTGTPAHTKRRLEPGDATEYLYAPALLDKIVSGEPRGIVVHDAVGRRFRAPDGSLAAAAGFAHRDQPFRVIMTGRSGSS
jgi:hypothetical protein